MVVVNGSSINVVGQLMHNSSAWGCLLWLEGKQEDHCVALPRTDDIIYYRFESYGIAFDDMHVYDIEENGLPHYEPAINETLNSFQSHGMCSYGQPFLIA